MRILITGGAGFIGSHVVEAYASSGHAVTVVDNLSTGSRLNLPSSIRFFEADICSHQLGKIFEEDKPEIVLHLAAQIDVRISLTNPNQDADTNIGGTLRVLECSKRAHVRKIVFASTGGAVYGKVERLPVTETIMPAPICHYGLSKWCAEKYIELYQRLYELDYTILRLPNVYGPRQNPHGEAGVCAILANLLMEGKAPTLYGHGMPLRDYVFVSDVANAFLAALDLGSNEVINIGSGMGTSVRQIFDMLQEIIGTRVEPNLLPLRAGEVAEIAISGNKAREVLGWTPTINMGEGLRQTVRSLSLARPR